MPTSIYPNFGINVSSWGEALLYGVKFEGNAQQVLAELPQPVRYDIGRQLFRLQEGMDPDDWKPLKAVGPGCREIRVWDESGTYRVIYVSLLAHTVHVLHAFQKKSQKTPMREVAIAAERYRALRRRIEDGKGG